MKFGISSLIVLSLCGPALAAGVPDASPKMQPDLISQPGVAGAIIAGMNVVAHLDAAGGIVLPYPPRVADASSIVLPYPPRAQGSSTIVLPYPPRVVAMDIGHILLKRPPVVA